MPYQTKSFSEYAKAISSNLKRGNATEHTHRPALKALLEASPDILATNEPRRIECGAPDYIVSAGPVTIGYVEAKDVGENLSKIERTDQLKRYLASLPNLVLTDYVEFRWYTDGQLRETARLGCVGDDGSIKTTRSSLDQVQSILDKFIQHKSPSVSTAKDLAVHMAHLGRMIRDITAETFALEGQKGTLHSQYQAFKETLVSDLTPDDFADMYAQTIAYGLFAARDRQPGKDFNRQTAALMLPKTNPFLRKLFGHIAGPELDDRIAWIVDNLAQVLADADMDSILEDFGRRIRQEDPVIHFYETFLAEYDPELRVMRGVYYTPEPVVSYIVRSVDYLLKEKFGKPQGLADPNVLILDPACGTGTFLFYVVKLIHQRMVEQGQQGGWSDYVEKHLLPRLFGFELLMSPYTIAHLKLGLLLRETGYEIRSEQRLNIYLTDSLEEGIKKDQVLSFAQFITEEANAAAEVKREKPIMVILGNPPYPTHSANKNPWINGLLKGRLPDGTRVPSYYEVDGKPLREKNSKGLQADYVKFIRFGQWRIDRTGYGILAYVTNHGYLNNQTFRGMRQQLMGSFTEISVLDLHGSVDKKEIAPDGSKDENVFDIQLGVAIGIFVKEKNTSGVASARHASLWGSREHKYKALLDGDLSSTVWAPLAPSAPAYFFVPQAGSLQKEYEAGYRIKEAMPTNSVGIVTSRDSLTVRWSREEVLATVRDFASLPTEVAREKYSLGTDTRDWEVSRAQADVKEHGIDANLVAPILYRPFDCRFTYYTGESRGFLCMPREKVMRHMLPGTNFGLSTTRSVEIGRGWEHVFCSSAMIQNHTVSLKEADYLFPIYLYPTQEKETQKTLIEVEPWPAGISGRIPNLSHEFVAEMEKRLELRFVTDGTGDLTQTFGPEDVFNYIYAVFHSPTYRKRYSEFLKVDFPRIPPISDKNLFSCLAAMGAELVSLHLMDSAVLNNLATRYPIMGSDIVEKVRYYEADHRVSINKKQYFEGVDPEVWQFHIGGYRVLEKWLKDRKGRIVTWDDQQHYQKVVVALKETMRLMKEIDEAIPSWPIESAAMRKPAKAA